VAPGSGTGGVPAGEGRRRGRRSFSAEALGDGVDDAHGAGDAVPVGASLGDGLEPGDSLGDGEVADGGDALGAGEASGAGAPRGVGEAGGVAGADEAGAGSMAAPPPVPSLHRPSALPGAPGSSPAAVTIGRPRSAADDCADLVRAPAARARRGTAGCRTPAGAAVSRASGLPEPAGPPTIPDLCVPGVPGVPPSSPASPGRPVFGSDPVATGPSGGASTRTAPGATAAGRAERPPPSGGRR